MGEAANRKQAVAPPGKMVMEASPRSVRRIHAALIASNTAAQLAGAVIQQAQAFMAGAQRELNEALGAVADANGYDMPAEYVVDIDQTAGTITITPGKPQAGIQEANGQVHTE